MGQAEKKGEWNEGWVKYFICIINVQYKRSGWKGIWLRFYFSEQGGRYVVSKRALGR